MARTTDCEGGIFFEGACNALARIGKTLGIRGTRATSCRMRRSRCGGGSDTLAKLQENLEVGGVQLDAEVVLVAANTAAVILGAGMIAASLASLVFLESAFFLVSALLTVVGPLLARTVFVSYPDTLAKRRAAGVLRSSTEGISLMIMSLRHEPSIPKALRFATRRESPFANELRRCLWDVIMGRHSSFEESLISLGSRWSRFSEELKAALNAMVTAATETSQEGKRRALDRANNALVKGTRRRIEDYALSLSTPSMIMFGLGILLPLMVGSFLPMLSWDLWSGNLISSMDDTGRDWDTIVQTVFLMDVLFPAMAFLVASDAVSRHPFDRPSGSSWRCRKVLVVLGGLSLVCAVGAWLTLSFVDSPLLGIGFLLSLTLPASSLAIWSGRGSASCEETEYGLEDALFRMGARMVEGENFESAFSRAHTDLRLKKGDGTRRQSLEFILAGTEDKRHRTENSPERSRLALDGVSVVRAAARKDELSAGLLAMDLATYMKDLRDLEVELKSRLKPVISMMKLTAFVLAPMVLGVTYGIYVSLSSIDPSAKAELTGTALLVVLGFFLAETNTVVSFFVWGIGCTNDRGSLAKNAGACVLISQLVYCATAVLAT